MISDTEMDLQNVHDNETVALAEIHALQDSETDTVTKIQVMQDSDADTVTLTVVQTRQESEQTEMKDIDPENDSNTPTTETNNGFVTSRRKAFEGQEKSAKRMKIRGEKIVQIPKVGNNATIQIPEFDRGPSDPKNLLVVILSAENNLYEVGCEQAKISTKFTAADLDLLSEKLIYPGDVPNDVSLTLRSVVGKRSGGQIFFFVDYVFSHSCSLMALLNLQRILTSGFD